jgi:hypothetical protein
MLVIFFHVSYIVSYGIMLQSDQAMQIMVEFSSFRTVRFLVVPNVTIPFLRINNRKCYKVTSYKRPMGECKRRKYKIIFLGTHIRENIV